MAMRRSPSSFSTRASWIDTMESICARPSRWNRMISSIRFRNSGLKWRRTLSMTSGRAVSTSASSGRLASASDPRLEVITIRVLRKSTVLPCPSVSRPSSSTCSSTLNTSGCAFSISSNRITA